MHDHPFVRNIFTVFVVLLFSSITGLCAAAFIAYYQAFLWPKAIGIGAVIAIVWLIGCYYSWYIFDFVKVWQAKWVIGLGIQAFSLLIFYFVFVPTLFVEEGKFIRQLPLLATFGTLIWIIVMQWYTAVQHEMPESMNDLPELSDTETESIPEENRIETLSVKSGTHIHIIPVEEIYFIQACGDYVNIFTKDGQFLKEQTMKSLETALPVSFIRIHRSTIINSMQLLRIELFGKENYHVQLKNGSTLKASLTGYKLLRNRLNL